MAFSEARQGFSPGTPVSSPPLLMVSANKIKLKQLRFKLHQT